MSMLTYTQLDLLAYRAPVMVAPPEPPVFRPKPHTADELWKMWKLQTSRLLIFNNWASGQQVSMDARLVKQFISAGRKTDATYLVTWLSTPHHYHSSAEQSEAEHTIAAGAGIRIDYTIGKVTGYAVFRDQAGLTELTAKRWQWYWEAPQHVFIG